MSTSAKNVVLALACLLCVGAGHRWVRTTRAGFANAYTAPAEPLVQLPTQIGAYLAVGDVPVRPDLVQASAVDSFVNRAYVAPETGAGFLLYVGYWGRENTGMGHGPEVCYPATGWYAQGSRTAEIVFDDPHATGRLDAEVGIHRFTKMEPLGLVRHVVGFTSITNDSIQASSRDLFWHRPAGLLEAGRFLAHVQVVKPVTTGSWEQAESEVEAFMATILPTIVEFLPGSETSVQSGDRR